MISNDIILNVSSFMMLFFLISWGGCFFIFVYKRLGRAKIGRDSLLYLNFIFFKRGALPGIALIFLFLGYMSASVAEYRRGFDSLLFIANSAGGISVLLFSLYGKYCYDEAVNDDNPFLFIKVFLTKLDLSFGSVFLWLSRLFYMIWLIVLIIN